jgi:hypothetical protein
MDLNKLCAGLTLAERDELLQIVTSYVESIDKSFVSTIDVVCTGCESGATRKLTYSKTNGTRCAECKTKLSPNAPKISEKATPILPLPHILTLCSGDVGGGHTVEGHTTTFSASEEDFTKIDIQAPLVYDPNVVLPSSGNGRGQFLKPGGL